MVYEGSRCCVTRILEPPGTDPYAGWCGRTRKLARASFLSYPIDHGKGEGMKVLVAGASGYLGTYIVKELLSRKISVKAIVRNSSSLPIVNTLLEVVEAQVTQRNTLEELFSEVDLVVSSVGITRQKEGLTYMDVDYQANVNLLDEAVKNHVKKFIYISVLNGDKLKHLKMCEAKEAFCEYLNKAPIESCIIRPNGFFSDMGDFLSMAERGKIFLFGDGEHKLNPIDGEDLAQVVVDAIDSSDKEIAVGGPDILTQNEIATLAFQASDKPVKIVHLPIMIQKLTLFF